MAFVWYYCYLGGGDEGHKEHTQERVNLILLSLWVAHSSFTTHLFAVQFLRANCTGTLHEPVRGGLFALRIFQPEARHKWDIM